jgi:hypothetical protein
MIRKSMLALAAIATLGTVALAPTSASAWGYKGWGWGFGHHHHFHGHYGFYAPRVVIGGDCYFVKRVNRHGYVRLIKVCD